MTDDGDSVIDDVRYPGGLTREQVLAQWDDSMSRCPELLPLFVDCPFGLTITNAAYAMGMPDRSALRKRLKQRRLPPYTLFRNWCYVVSLVDKFSDRKTSLAHWAMYGGRETSQFYDLVLETTGSHWRETLLRGSVWARGLALQVWSVHL